MLKRPRSTESNAGTRTLAAIGVGALVLYGSRVLLDFFGPSRGYELTDDAGCALDSEEFTQFLSVVTDGTVRRARMTRLKNGAEFYGAQMEAIRRAKHSINLETYEFLEGDVAREMLEALSERARAGVEVRLIVDALGSFGTSSTYFDELRAAGGRMEWYHPMRWDTWQKANNRTHRKVLVVDGQTGFLGGAGVGDQWLHGTAKTPAWRDTVFCVEGRRWRA